jgi:hypothetical protein
VPAEELYNDRLIDASLRDLIRNFSVSEEVTAPLEGEIETKGLKKINEGEVSHSGSNAHLTNLGASAAAGSSSAAGGAGGGSGRPTTSSQKDMSMDLIETWLHGGMPIKGMVTLIYLVDEEDLAFREGLGFSYCGWGYQLDARYRNE